MSIRITISEVGSSDHGSRIVGSRMYLCTIDKNAKLPSKYQPINASEKCRCRRVVSVFNTTVKVNTVSVTDRYVSSYSRQFACTLYGTGRVLGRLERS